MFYSRYSLIAVINGQEFRSNNNTYEEFKKLVDMITGFGGWVVEYTEHYYPRKKRRKK